MGLFADGTRVTQRPHEPGADPADADSSHSAATVVFDTEIAPGWDVLGNANGGYLMSMLGRAATAASGRPDVVSISTAFLAPGRPGPATIELTPVKSGRMFATQRVDLVAGGRTTLAATVITGDLANTAGPELVAISAPPIPPVEECPRALPGEVFPPPFTAKVDMRPHPDDVMGVGTEPRVRAWFRVDEDGPADTLAAIVAADALPPTVFTADIKVGWSPTVQMTTHLRARPASQWLLVDTISNVIAGSMFETDATVFDEDGTVVAQARQLQLIAQG